MRLLLVDGNYYAYRSFFAIRGLSNSKGEPTNAIFGFVKAIRRMIQHLSPDFAAVCWDTGLPLRRVELQPTYKQHRAEMPDDMAPQLPFIRELVTQMGLHNLSLPDTEADDLMASYACAAHQEDICSVLATNDKDLLSLVDDCVSIYSTAKADLTPPEEFALLGVEAITRKWGVPPPRILDVLALSGDASDNIAGVPGVGPKTATTLILEAGSVESLLENVAALPNVKLRDKIAAAESQIRQNCEMVRLDTDLPLPMPVRQLTITPRYDALIASIERCEFRSLLVEIKAEAKASAPPSPPPAQEELFPF